MLICTSNNHTISWKKMTTRTWLSQGSRNYRTANHFFSFAQWDMSWICSVTWVKEDVNASPILSSNTANTFWVLSGTLLWNSEMKENDNTWVTWPFISQKRWSSNAPPQYFQTWAVCESPWWVSSNLSVFPFVYQFNSRIWVLVHSSFPND